MSITINKRLLALSLASLLLAALPASTVVGCKWSSCKCDASVVKRVNGELIAGQRGHYAIHTDYHGSDSCDDGALCVTDDLPAGLTCDPNDNAYTHGSPDPNPQWDCSCTGTAVKCCFNQHPLPSFLSLLPTIDIPVLVSAEAPAAVTNCAKIEDGFDGAFEDNNADNNLSCITSSVAAPRWDLFLTKSHTGTVIAGGTAKFQIHVSNLGPSDATGFTVTDTLPAGFTFVSASPSNWSCSGIQVVTCTFNGSLPPQTSAVPLIIETSVANVVETTDVQNCAEVQSKGDMNPKNNSACDPVTILACKTWSAWTDVDNPSTTGDWEIVTTNFPNACPVSAINPEGQPVGLECQTIDGLPFPQPADPTATCSLPGGLVCVNAKEPDNTCLDYKIRICCP